MPLEEATIPSARRPLISRVDSEQEVAGARLGDTVPAAAGAASRSPKSFEAGLSQEPWMFRALERRATLLEQRLEALQRQLVDLETSLGQRAKLAEHTERDGQAQLERLAARLREELADHLKEERRAVRSSAMEVVEELRRTARHVMEAQEDGRRSLELLAQKLREEQRKALEDAGASVQQRLKEQLRASEETLDGLILGARGHLAELMARAEAELRAPKAEPKPKVPSTPASRPRSLSPFLQPRDLATSPATFTWAKVVKDCTVPMEKTEKGWEGPQLMPSPPHRSTEIVLEVSGWSPTRSPTRSPFDFGSPKLKN